MFGPKSCLLFCLVHFQQNPNDTEMTLGNSHDLKMRVWLCRILE